MGIWRNGTRGTLQMFYKVNKASKNKFDAKFEVWRLNKAKGFYNFVRYTNDDSQENINKIILENSYNW